MITEISPEIFIAALSETLQLPVQIPTIHCRAHMEQKDKAFKSSNLLGELQQMLLKHDSLYIYKLKF